MKIIDKAGIVHKAFNIVKTSCGQWTATTGAIIKEQGTVITCLACLSEITKPIRTHLAVLVDGAVVRDELGYLSAVCAFWAPFPERIGRIEEDEVDHKKPTCGQCRRVATYPQGVK